MPEGAPCQRNGRAWTGWTAWGEGHRQRPQQGDQSGVAQKAHAGALTTSATGTACFRCVSWTPCATPPVVIGDVPGNPFQQELSHYAPVKQLAIGQNAHPGRVQALEKELEGVDVLITSVHQTSFTGPRATSAFRTPPSWCCAPATRPAHGPRPLRANPYRLANTDAVHRLDGLVVAYEGTRPDAQAMAAQALFGARATDGVLPVTASLFFSGGDGLRTAALGTFA